MNRIEKLIKLRDEVFSWAKIELQGQIVFNTDAQIEIFINNRGLKHTLKGKSYKNFEMLDKNEAMIMSVRHLKYYLANSKYQGFEKDNRKRNNLIGFHIFTNIFIYKNIEYGVKIIVRETVENIYFYDQALIEKK